MEELNKQITTQFEEFDKQIMTRFDELESKMVQLNDIEKRLYKHEKLDSLLNTLVGYEESLAKHEKIFINLAEKTVEQIKLLPYRHILEETGVSDGLKINCLTVTIVFTAIVCAIIFRYFM